MSRYERRIYFEWLVEKRAGVRERSATRTGPRSSAIADVIAWAEHELARTSVAGSTPATEA